MIVLGIHGGVTIGQHDPGACVVIDGRVAALCEEERYLRVKEAYGFLPYHSIRAALAAAGVTWEDVDLVVSPGATYGDFEARLRDFLRHSFGSCPRLLRVHHQKAHLATAFYGSGLDDAVVLSLDATGDGCAGFTGRASTRDGIKVEREIANTNSLGFFYTMITHYLGFADGDEYKVMGLAAYGRPNIDLTPVIRPTADGYQFDNSFLRHDPPPRSRLEPAYGPKLSQLLGQPNRVPSAPVTDFHRDLARSTQGAFEDALIGLLRAIAPAPNNGRKPNLCYAGGVALNCSANGKIFETGLFDQVYVSPVAADRGLALGCAYLGAVELGDSPQPIAHAYLGTAYGDDAIRAELAGNGCRFVELSDPAETAAELIARGKIVGWHQGRSEAGARALGNRSILASAESAAMRDKVNARIKYREEFRPFAPSVLVEEGPACFQTGGRASPYMCFTFPATAERAPRMGAVVHNDGTARIQTVSTAENPLYHKLISAYRRRTGMPVVLNTSFNLKGQPIVETPRDALMTFFGCGLDALILGRFMVEKPDAVG
jgi:carbamoyltransferase